MHTNCSYVKNWNYACDYAKMREYVKMKSSWVQGWYFWSGQSFSQGFYILISRVTSEREETPRMTVSAPTGKALGGRWGAAIGRMWELSETWRCRVVAMKVWRGGRTSLLRPLSRWVSRETIDLLTPGINQLHSAVQQRLQPEKKGQPL